MFQIGQQAMALSFASSDPEQALEQPAGLQLFAEQEEVGWHAHQESQLVWVTQGCMSMETSRGRWLVPAGRMGWFPGREPHRGRVLRPASGISLYVRQDWLSYPTVFDGSELGRALLKALLQPAAGAVQARRLAALADEVRLAKALSVGLPLAGAPRLKRLCEALAHDPAKAPPLEQAAAQVALSRRSFSRHFKLETGMSYGQWLQLARVHQSLVLLAEGGRVGDVALAVGYDSVSAFCQAFRQLMGLSPKRWQSGG